MTKYGVQNRGMGEEEKGEIEKETVEKIFKTLIKLKFSLV
jgi:hypothetical protein